MRNMGMAAVCLLLGTGCSPDLSDRIARACVKDGTMNEAQCQCVADRAENDLSKNAQALILAEMEDDNDRVEALTKQMSLQDAASVGSFMMNAMRQCATGSSD